MVLNLQYFRQVVGKSCSGIPPLEEMLFYSNPNFGFLIDMGKYN